MLPRGFEIGGNALTFYILTENGKFISRSLVFLYMSEDNINMEKEIVHALREILQTPELPMVGPLEFICQNVVHKYKGVPIKETVVASLGNVKFKINLPQEGDDAITYSQLMDSLSKGEEVGNQYWMFQKFIGHRKDPTI